jgi:hypothetical protein
MRASLHVEEGPRSRCGCRRRFNRDAPPDFWPIACRPRNRVRFPGLMWTSARVTAEPRRRPGSNRSRSSRHHAGGRLPRFMPALTAVALAAPRSTMRRPARETPGRQVGRRHPESRKPRQPGPHPRHRVSQRRRGPWRSRAASGSRGRAGPCGWHAGNRRQPGDVAVHNRAGANVVLHLHGEKDLIGTINFRGSGQAWDLPMRLKKVE